MTIKTLSIEIGTAKWAINVFRDDEDTIELKSPDKSNDVDGLISGRVYSVAIAIAATAGTEFKVKIGEKVICDAKTDETNSYAKVHFSTI